MRISDWSSDVCSSDLIDGGHRRNLCRHRAPAVCYPAGKIHEGRDREAFVAEGRASACAKVRRIEDRAREVGDRKAGQQLLPARSEEHTSELQSLMRISYAVFCLKKKNNLKQAFKTNHNATTHKYKQPN